MKQKRKHHPRAIREAAIAIVLSGKKTAEEVAHEYRIKPGNVRQWVKRHLDPDYPPGPKPKPPRWVCLADVPETPITPEEIEETREALRRTASQPAETAPKDAPADLAAVVVLLREILVAVRALPRASVQLPLDRGRRSWIGRDRSEDRTKGGDL
jgi:transposase-like protein